MSVTHILNSEGAVSCRATVTRGFLTLPEFLQLRQAGKLRQQIKTSVKHSCSIRRHGQCYTVVGGRETEANCPRTKTTASGICSKCANMY